MSFRDEIEYRLMQERAEQAALYVQQFQETANQFKFGYLKDWKAMGILRMLAEIPDIMEDEERLISYLKRCLLMEGFTEEGCVVLSTWLRNNLKF